jgi:hypothetical protein
MKKVERIVKEIEEEFVQLSRVRNLPLTEPEQIKSVIWNLLTSEKWKKEISYKDYSAILDIWFKRLINNKNGTK